MSDVTRGSDKLKQTCCAVRELNADELSAVAGGAALSSYLTVFPKGIPWPEIFKGINTTPVVTPVINQIGF
jgi:hypothetical protein